VFASEPGVARLVSWLVGFLSVPIHIHSSQSLHTYPGWRHGGGWREVAPAEGRESVLSVD
jgi:hypothetical protein